MVSNQTGAKMAAVAQRYYPWGLFGHLYSPDGWREPMNCFPYALDNGAYAAYKRGAAWDGEAFLRHCDKTAAADQPPMWVVCPDVVADRAATLRQWDEWAPRLRREYGWSLAFAVQDGMAPVDVPGDHSLVFVGGTMTWKLNTLALWCGTFSRVHVARINRVELLYRCQELGAESVDGTGWWHEDSGQWQGLCRWAAEQTGETMRVVLQSPFSGLFADTPLTRPPRRG